ncbi:MAG: tetratricopeptide repeat protein [Cyanobacteria bacterium P01_D01_bin.6]
MNSSDRPWPTSKLDSESPEFLGLNLEAVQSLANFIDLSEDFRLAFAEVNFVPDVDLLIAALQQRPECQQVQFLVFDFSQTKLTSLLAELMLRLESVEYGANKKPAIILRGLETSIGGLGKESPFLQDLNFVRDALARRVSHPMVMILPKYALKRLARTAKDFWSWASIVLAFRSARERIETVQSQVMRSDYLFSSDLAPVKQSRIDQLNALLEEYAPTEHEPDDVNAVIRLSILLELGDAYTSLAQMKAAQTCFAQALHLAQMSQQKWYEAQARRKLGQVLQFLKQSQEALSNYESALTIYREVGDRLGEANTLKAQGDVRQFLDQRSEALSNYESALTIYRAVGARLGEANTLKAQGDVRQFLDQRSEALSNYESALTIYRAVGDRLGEANTLQGLGRLKDSPDVSLANFLAAQKIYQEIGDRYNMGRNLALFLGPAYAISARTESAIAAFQEAADIGTAIGFEPLTSYARQQIDQIEDN